MSDSTFYRGKKVLVTGGTGFVGSHIVDELLRLGAHVRIPIHERPPIVRDERIETVRADLTRVEDCRTATRGVQYVFHAAGTVSGAGVPSDTIMSGITLNLVLTAQMLQGAWQEGVERTLIFSSSAGYPAADHAVTEEEMWSAPPYANYFGYAWMRRYFERLSEFVASKSPMKIALLRPTAVYGRRDNFNPATAHVIPALIRRAVEKQDPFVVRGTGKEVRDFLHITDLARGCRLLLEKHAVCDPVNIGYGRAITIEQTVRAILRAAGHDAAKLVFDSTDLGAIPVRMVDITKARTLLGFEPQVSLEDGLADTVKWFQASRRGAAGDG
jgi:GDP-L-fucose synthase